MYSGGGCTESDNDQATGKAICTALPTGSVISGPITVVYAGGNSNLSTDSYVVEPTTVGPDGTFTVSWNGADLKADSYIKVCDADNDCELNKIHTSCSQPLAVNDVFGSLTLVGFNGNYAGAEVKYLYEVKNLGTGSLTITSVLDDVLGEQLDPKPQTLAGGASLTLDEAFLVTGTITNTVTVSTPDLSCKATDSLTVTMTTPPPPDINVFQASAPTLDGTKFYWKLTNSGPDAAIITKVEVFAWPSQQGKLKKIKLDGDVAADPPDISAPPAVITVLASDVSKKQIAAGQTRAFTIEFEKNYLLDVPTEYKFTITFEGGETISWNVP